MFKKFLLALLVAAAGLSLTSCNEEQETAKTRRTLLVYIEGRNNLSSAAKADLEEMHQALVPADCRLLVYRSISGDDHPVLMEIVNGKDFIITNYDAEAMATDPEHMRRVMRDMERNAPSDEYGVIFWSHSSGWRQKSPSITRGYGLEYSSQQMSITDMADVLKDFNFDFIFFDTCYMGCVEVAYELRNVARRMVASVCEVPTEGMPYNLTIPHFFNTNTDLGLKAVIDITVNYYATVNSNKPSSCPSTLSLINLSKLDDVALEVKRVINNPLPGGSYQNFSISAPYKDLFFDLEQYIEALGGDISVLSNAVIYERHTSYPIWGKVNINRCCGLTVYIPLSPLQNYKLYDYNTLSWAKYLNLN
ncbi:MAG: clostripain-related cysteine peptidase [Bacteroides sp.]|nr:clostripain-related cysteine peptidase [Bacteroides sp.]MCM1379169.1 clostripain-related cysteine peptidase [Bacteroides sp.]MCM1445182.1 clostripain-related cysteine peptidase [Prevotella sp.]